MDYREDLKAYLDGELSVDRAEQVRVALASDAALARELDELRAVTSTLRATPQPQPYGMEQTLLALEAAKRSSRRKPIGWWFGLGLAAAGSLAIGAVLLNRPGIGAESSEVAANSPSMFDLDMDRAAPKESKASAATGKIAMKDRTETPLDGALVDGGPSRESYQRPVPVPRKEARAADKAKTASKPQPSGPHAPALEESSQRAGGSALAAVAPEKSEALSAPPGGRSEVEITAAKTTTASQATTEAQPLELKVASLPIAELTLKEIAAKHEGVFVMTQDRPEAKDSRETREMNRTIVLEVPEDQVEQVMTKLKELPAKVVDKLESVRMNFGAPGQAGLGGGAGGFGGASGQRGAAGPAQNQAGNQSQALQNQNQTLNQGMQGDTKAQGRARDQIAKRDNRKPTRKISIVLVTEKKE